MMVRKDAPQGALFYDFSLSRIVPEGHLLRRLMPFLICRASGKSFRLSIRRMGVPRLIRT